MEKSKIYNLHEKYAKRGDTARILDLIWTHSEIIAKIALLIADNLEKSGFNVNRDLVEEGALIHDIGVYECFDEDLIPDKKLPPYITHGEAGYKLLKAEGFPEKTARFAITHTGTGITKEDIERENLPFTVGDYIPITLEEEIVCYADKFHSKYPGFSSFEEQRERLSKFDASKGIIMDRFKKKFGIPDTLAMEKEYKNWQEEFDGYFKAIEEKRS